MKQNIIIMIGEFEEWRKRLRSGQLENNSIQFEVNMNNI